MIKAVYSRTLTILKKIPVKLWGLSLLNGLLVSLLPVLGVNLLIVSLPLTAALEAGMILIYYMTYSTGDIPDSKPMFAAFKDFQKFKHIAGGMCWMYLWIFLWLLIPFAGIFFAVYKAIQYSFTPYILLEEPEVRALDALKKSKEDTKGLKLGIFLGTIVPALAYCVLIMIFIGTAVLVNPAGLPFLIIASVLLLIYSLFAPLFFGLVEAGFYEYGKKPAVKKAAAFTPNLPPVTCSACGTVNAGGEKFCSKCGGKL